jgi:hypothetical protein
MNKVTCGIATVLIGREFALTPLLNYFKNVELPNDIDVNLYLTLGCDSDFEVILKDKIEELELNKKYNNIYFVKGVSKCYSDLSWNEWETFTRQQDPNKKHRAALNNIEIALEAAKEETYIHFVDDDTIPPYHALKDLLKSYQSINNCGIASGIYFNKTWVGPTAAVGEIEASRRIVGSYKKETWLNCSIDDLAIENYQDVGFVGNGCMLVAGNDVKQILPLSEWREQGDEEAPPDFIICRRIRRLGKIVSIVPSIIAEHLDQAGNPVGLTLEYLNNIKNSTGTLNYLITHYDKYLNYEILSKQYDKVLVIYYTEIHKELPSKLYNFSNVEIIKRSIEETCSKYTDIKNYSKLKGESMQYVILEEMHNFVKDKSNYVTYYYNTLHNTITKIPLLDSNNLKKLLNKKP